MIIFCLFVFNCCIFFPQFSFHNMVTYLLWWEGTFLGTLLNSDVFEKIVLFESYSSNFSLDCHVVFTFTLPNVMICSLLLVYALSCLMRKGNWKNLSPYLLFCLGVYFCMSVFPHFFPYGRKQQNELSFTTMFYS